MTTKRQHDYIVTLREDALNLAKAQLTMVEKYHSDDKAKIAAAAKKQVKDRSAAFRTAKKNRDGHIKNANKRKK